MRGVHFHQSVGQFERKCWADISHDGDVSPSSFTHREVKDASLQLQCSSAICWAEINRSRFNGWSQMQKEKKIYQNMWFCASAPVCFDNNGGLLFWLGVPTSVSTHQSTWQRLQRLTRLTAGTVVTPRGRERHQHGYCGAGVTQHQRCGRFVFANTRHTAPHARHRAKRGVLCA